MESERVAEEGLGARRARRPTRVLPECRGSEDGAPSKEFQLAARCIHTRGGQHEGSASSSMLMAPQGQSSRVRPASLRVIFPVCGKRRRPRGETEKARRNKGGQLRASNNTRARPRDHGRSARANIIQRSRPSQARHTHMTRELTQRAQQRTTQGPSGSPLHAAEMQGAKLRRRGERSWGSRF